jgi:hypothetical protein
MRVQGSNDRGSFRLGQQPGLRWLTPGSAVVRRGGSFTTVLQLTALLIANANLQYFSDERPYRPGSGYDEQSRVWLRSARATG